MRQKPTSESGFFNPRVFAAFLLAAVGLSLAMFSFAANPPTGSIAPGGTPVTWAGTGSVANGGGESSCASVPNSCDSFALTISGTPLDWAAALQKVHVEIDWLSYSSDFDMFVHKGDLSGPVVAESASGGTVKEQVDLDPNNPNIGTGLFTVHVVYFAATSADQYHGTASVAPTGAKPVPAPTPSTAVFAPRFENFNPPAAGPNTLGLHSGEPSIGVGAPITGHPEGRAMFQSDASTLRVAFNGCTFPRALWENKPATTSVEDFDPILWSDPTTGRTIVSLLSFAADPVVPQMSYTDNDGDSYTPVLGARPASGIDHQTVGGGPYNPNAAPPAPHPYPNAIYYCSQALVDASCARSDDGGLTYTPAFLTYRDECGGLHGHVQVGPDGTVYLPNKGCGGEQAAVVSEDNGVSWSIRPVPGSVSGGSDPSVAIDKGGKVYFGYGDGDTKMVVTTSTNHGASWSQPYDVGAVFGLINVAYPAFVGGDADRAAVAFLGTPTSGGLQGSAFAGVWHLYVATTYDGGASWTTVDATPNDAVQRGCIWQGGGANVCRNLLDFFGATIDHQGRILVGYADGCAGAECAQAPSTASGNAYTALAAIARQSGGKRMFAAFDSAPDAKKSVPGVPSLSAHRGGSVVKLSWSEADKGGSSISGYNVYRGTAPGAETLLASLGTQVRYTDTTASNTGVTYYYKVTATNAQGTSCDQNEVSAVYLGSSKTGYRVLSDPSGLDEPATASTPDLDIQSLTVAQPTSGANSGKLVFKLKVASLASIPNERMWRIVWNSPKSPTAQFYLGMTKDATGVLSYEYGTVETSTVGLVLGVPTTTKVGTPDVGSFTPDGTITIGVSPDKIGSVRVGDLLGGMAVRTYATVTNQIRSTNAIDTTSNATANDLTANAATYVVISTPTTK